MYVKSIGIIYKTLNRSFSRIKHQQQIKSISSICVTNLNKLETKFEQDHFEIKYKGLFKDLPYIWLRDNCRCTKCYNKEVQEVELDLQRIPIDIRPINVQEISNDSESVKITWEDGHLSEYNLNELANLALENELNESKKTYWNCKILEENEGGLKKFKYDKYLSDDSVLREALKSILKYGAVLIVEVPAKLREIVTVSERIAKIQSSIFGPGDCVVTNQLGFTDRAYTSLPLKAHNDNVYQRNTAGLEAFHIVQKADEGGESVLIDGFYCAQQLRDNHPNDFEMLTNTMVKCNFKKQGEFDLSYTDNFIKLNPLNKNEFYQIRYNAYYQQNVSHLKNKIEIRRFYEALKNFVEQVENPANQLWLSLEPNQVLIFDNFRMLHGRNGFKGNRTLVTTYMPHDEWLNKANILGATK